MKFDDLCKLFESKLLDSTDKLSKIVDGFKFALLALKKR